ncbi:MAG: bifunctional 4'-phosphopantothenoylcysteine decarboxylase/phosphopantothenoylcysteine synthetase, partial [Anaerolineaceae bacterium]|nr:bifunctional 4'-phosphopantothenoylcysteine decarboxylase/phosphopantothenoylcysteine synthetase [Anaerolineaceae bacterium]
AKVIRIHTAQELLDAVIQETASADALIMAAAVADYRPATPAGQKIKKKDAALQITLEPTQDILAKVAEKRLAGSKPDFVIGFAAESQDLILNAEKKLKAKRLDMIVANDISAANAGFEVDTNRVTLLKADGSQTQLPLMSKLEVAGEIVQELITWFEKGH